MEQQFLVDGPLMDNHKLEAPIPPLHVQQKYLNDSNKIINSDSNLQFIMLVCSRCKKNFQQPLIVPKTLEEGGEKPLVEPKVFKLCQHCRELQRQRSRRWQKKTKEKVGVCRRCGNDIPPELQKFVLCLNCRQNLRFRKANRAKQGRCVHCSGPLDTSIISSNLDNPDDKKEKNFKVCKRCRENDKIRRNNLEKLGHCNRCARPLAQEDIGKHKVCGSCRSKKKKLGFDQPQDATSGLSDVILQFNPYNQSHIQQQLSQALQPLAPIPVNSQLNAQQQNSAVQPPLNQGVQYPYNYPVNYQYDLMRQPLMNQYIPQMQIPLVNYQNHVYMQPQLQNQQLQGQLQQVPGQQAPGQQVPGQQVSNLQVANLQITAQQIANQQIANLQISNLQVANQQIPSQQLQQPTQQNTTPITSTSQINSQQMNNQMQMNMNNQMQMNQMNPM